jgi:hypothetical protein
MNLKIDVVIYGIEPSNSINVFRNEDTIGYYFVNTGNTPVEINNLILLPGSTWKTLEPGYTDKTFYKVRFNQSNNLYNTCGTNNSSLTVLIYSKVL